MYHSVHQFEPLIPSVLPPALNQKAAEIVRLSARLAAHLLAGGLLLSDTALGPVRFGLPLDSLQFLLPELYPEAATKPE